MTDKQTYIAKLSQWSRADLLKTCRAAGLTAHRLATNEQLAELLWNATAPMRSRKSAAHRPAWAVTERDALKAEIAGRSAAAAYLAGDSLG